MAYLAVDFNDNRGYTPTPTLVKKLVWGYTFAVNSAKKLGENMKRIRTEKQMSQGDICRKLNVDRSYISNVENGNKNPTLSTITKLAKALGVSVDELLK